ncbi:uncharacterized protein Dwil_GK11992 [Drosophila willistoni]|uniref:Uncharacterized protein n=1 Tax=Drosophila willistoni TaxID=7260 RepID=B4N849_DROWI|nr:uncharacterized protein LOC6647408 [Drosophila willistoni]EDW81300.2 uncharacterized protein Dwil_GK11992 [Drosophila willistoni]
MRMNAYFAQSSRESKMSEVKRRSKAFKISKRRATGFPRRLGYDQQNIQNTSHIPAAQRSYGLIKTSKTMTPFPMKSPKLDETHLRLRLQAEKIKRGSKTPSEDASTRVSIHYVKPESPVFTPSDSGIEGEIYVEQRHSSTRSSVDLPFELRRRLFDEGEYTIAKGKKMGESVMNHELARWMNFQSCNPLQKTPGSYFGYFYDLEKVCRKLNIKMAKGFEL